MVSRQKAVVAAVAWATIVGAGLSACGGGGGGSGSGSGSTASTGSTPGTGTALSGAAPGSGTALSSAVPDVGATPGSGGTGTAAVAAAASSTVLADCDMFPADAIFNTRIDDTTAFPTHSSSTGWINGIGGGTPFHADWWLGNDPTQLTAYYGIPWNSVDSGGTSWPQVQYDFAGGLSGWPHESDCAVADANGFGLQRNCAGVPAQQRRFPFPSSNVKNEGGACSDPNSCGDHHVLVVEKGACRLWEAYHAYQLGGQWYALSTAAWDLKSNAMRPNGWTSGDAAGLPITPFVAKAAEASSGEIRHALRVTFRDSAIANSYTWPARHSAGSSGGSVPFGSVLRLRADFQIPANWTTQAKAIATAAKRYGLYVADIGMDFYVQGEPSADWDPATFGQLATIPLGQMEFVDLRNVTGHPNFSPDSFAAPRN